MRRHGARLGIDSRAEDISFNSASSRRRTRTRTGMNQPALVLVLVLVLAQVQVQILVLGWSASQSERASERVVRSPEGSAAASKVNGNEDPGAARGD
mmetsp:Transcript_12461/g.24187  ORF Transcript_12461/g.24187 Transcript_12461/m.24187 type:complete len:97 (-) Transcript_12461:733-1023(-)